MKLLSNARAVYLAHPILDCSSYFLSMCGFGLRRHYTRLIILLPAFTRSERHGGNYKEVARNIIKWDEIGPLPIWRVKWDKAIKKVRMHHFDGGVPYLEKKYIYWFYILDGCKLIVATPLHSYFDLSVNKYNSYKMILRAKIYMHLPWQLVLHWGFEEWVIWLPLIW
jgi:hypothetical protein